MNKLIDEAPCIYIHMNKWIDEAPCQIKNMYD